MMDDVTQRGQFGQGQILSKDTQQVIQRTVSSSQTFAEGGREQSGENLFHREGKINSPALIKLMLQQRRHQPSMFPIITPKHRL